MKKQFTEEQIIGILRSHEKGVTVLEICHKHGIAEQNFYRWKSKYGGMEVSDAKKLKHLEDENRRLKQLVGELTLDNQALKRILEKNT